MGRKKELAETGLEYLGKTKVSPFKYRQELIKNELQSLRKANPEMTVSDMSVIINKDFVKKNLKPISTSMAQQHASNIKLPKAAEPKTFNFKGVTYPKSKGVKTYNVDPTRASGVHPRWVPKAIRGKKERPHLVQQPWMLKQQAEMDEIKGVMRKMDLNELRYSSGKELVELMKKKLPKISRDPNSLVRMKNEVMGGGTKGAGMTKIKDELGNPVYSSSDHYNQLLPESQEGVLKFFKTLVDNSPKGISPRQKMARHMDRMIYTAKLQGATEEELVSHLLTKTNFKKLGEFIALKEKFTELGRIAKRYGIDLPTVEIAHKEAVAVNWRKTFDVDNLYFADSKGNRYLQDDIEKQIRILNDYLRGKKNKSGHVEILPTGEKRVVLNKERRKEHMKEYYKDRTPAEIQKDLEEARLMAKVEGVEYGAKFNPNDLYGFKAIYEPMELDIGSQLRAGSHGMLARGGLVNGYSKGGKVRELLDDAIGMMSRRKFLKGMGATAASTAMPKGLLKATPALSKEAMNFAPPWVNGMLSALKGVKTWSPTLDHTVGNNASLINIGSKYIKVFKDEKAKITYFKVKTADYKVADEAAVKRGEKPGDSWDDVELREEPGETTITWKNKDYDGNDQHIVIDKVNKETRFVDDNWHMEAGGEDVAKDDWIEWAITPNKNEIKVALKKPLSEIDDATVDGYSVNDMEDYGMDSYVDSFSPSGNIFGTVERMVKKMKKKNMARQEQKKLNDEAREKEMMDWEDQFRGGQGIHAYDRGGIARRPNAVPPTSGPDPYATLIDESVAQIRNNPSEFMGSQFIQKFNKGGYVRKNAPKVIGMLTNYKPKLTMAPELKKAQPKMAGKRIIEEEETVLEPGAMFWGSREKIIGAPSEAMTGTQWLTYMKLGKHGILNPRGFPIIKDMELNDTSLAPWLSRMGNKTVSKESLVKQFDEMAPTMDVVALGDATGVNLIDKVSRRLKKIDTQAIRNPQIKGFYDYMKTVMPQLKESLTSTESKGIIKSIDDMVYNNFGIKDALTEGVPQRFPFEIKEILQSLSTAFGKRTAGFKKYKRTTQHEGTQMMEGGDNYREFLFRYKSGSLRSNEPKYRYAHDFNLSDADRAGGVVHTRTSDRGDEFGRRLLHIEEIQSDMHQKVNAAQRKLKKMHAEWAKEGKTPEGEYARMTTERKRDYDKLVASSKYAPRGDLKEEIGTANEQHFALVKAKIEDLLAQPQTKQTITRLTKLKRERTKIRKMIEEEKAKMAEGSHSGVPQGPLSKTEDYNEFIMKYLLRVAREGGYDGISINTPAIKNKGLNVTNQDYRGNLVAYGPMAKGAMEKAAKKSGAKFMKTYIKDGDKKVWEVPMIVFKENKAAQAIIDKGLPVYKKGGIVKK